MPKYPFEPEIKKAAQAHGLDPDLVAAVCWQESKFNPDALRWEPKFQRKYIDRHPTYEKLDSKTRNLLASSLGLMQVMGVIAHEFGLPLTLLEDLYKPAVGLEYGCKKLQNLMRRYGVEENPKSEYRLPQETSSKARQSRAARNPRLEDAVAAYNAGIARRGDKGGYKNQGYVDKVLKKYQGYKRISHRA